MVVKIPKILCGIALGIAALLAIVFLLDLAIGIPLGRSSVSTDIVVVLASALILWFGIETWLELSRGKR